ncbi:unnamed protein product [Rangifer tarandus platyrhynchus]|uniref:Uncharacterized protein n=1 Tax=Rangifer tarandus platyrhynchus TaxID=3082113 RepID=A0ABN8XSE0_RANTA|nr:unnamed protein product [Rangifer tarandus platyrhynchus]
MGVEGKGRRDRETDGALALDGRRPDGPGIRGSCGARSGDAVPGTRAEAGGEVSLLAGSAAGPQPCAPRQVGAGRLRGSPLAPAAVVPGSGGGQAAGGDRGATPLFPTFFRSFWGLGGECTVLEPARRWGSGGEVAGYREDSDHTSREGPPSSEWPGDYLQVI